MFAVDFKSEEEVKDYIKNVGTEYSFQCYKEKTPDGCYRLGDFFSAVKNDFPQAAKAYQKSCEEFGHARGCSKIGAFYLYGKGVEREKGKALRYFKQGCDGGSMDACFGAGSVLLSPKKGDSISEQEQSRDKGLEYLRNACENKHQASCFNLSALYIKGLSGVERNMDQAIKYSVKSCDLGHVYGCANASRMYAIGDGVEKNQSLASRYKERAKMLHKEVKETNQQLRFGET